MYAYQCGNYLAERFDEYDRQGLIHRAEAGYAVRNSLTVISRGLINKCEDILLGDTAWIEKYKQSSRFLEVRVPPKVAEILNNLGDFCAH